MQDLHTSKVDDTPFDADEMSADITPRVGKRRLTPDGDYSAKATLGSKGVFDDPYGNRKIHIQVVTTGTVRVPSLNGFTTETIIGRKQGSFLRLTDKRDRVILRQLLVGQGFDNAQIDSVARLEEQLRYAFSTAPADGIDVTFYSQWGAYNKNYNPPKPKDGDVEGWKEYNLNKNVKGMTRFPRNADGTYSSTYVFPDGTEAEANENILSFGAPKGGVTAPQAPELVGSASKK